jgi:hypothetical protein
MGIVKKILMGTNNGKIMPPSKNDVYKGSLTTQGGASDRISNQSQPINLKVQGDLNFVLSTS